MATNIVGVTMPTPAGDPNPAPEGNFVMGGQITTSGGGGWAESGDMYFQWDQGTATWTDLASTGALNIAAQTNPITGLQTTEEQQITVYNDGTTGTFNIRVKLIEDDLTEHLSSTQEVTVAGLTHYTIVCDPASFAFGGTAANLEYGRHLDASAASFAFAGADATLLKDSKVAAESGNFPFAGTAATLLKDSILVPETVNFPFAGADVTLSKGRTMTVEGGAFAFSGFDASLIKDSVLVPEAAAFAFSGTAADLVRGYVLQAASVNFPFAGFSAGSLHNRVLTASSANFPFAGSDAELTLGAVAGNNVYTGFSMTMIPR